MWVSDPLDIIVHEHAKRAMYAVGHAEMLASLLLEAYSVDIDPPIEDLAPTSNRGKQRQQGWYPMIGGKGIGVRATG